MKIVRIETIGFKNTRRLLSKSYDLTRQEFASKGKILPPASVIDFKRNSDYRMFLTPRKIILHTEQDGVLIFRFDEGYITDLVSSPRIFRSLVDNDDARLVEASLVHDALFSRALLVVRVVQQLVLSDDAPRAFRLGSLAARTPRGERSHRQALL